MVSWGTTPNPTLWYQWKVVYIITKIGDFLVLNLIVILYFVVMFQFVFGALITKIKSQLSTSFLNYGRRSAGDQPNQYTRIPSAFSQSGHLSH